MKVKAGQLKHRVSFLDPAPEKNSLGEVVEAGSFTPYGDRWAAIWPVSAKERIKHGRDGGEITHRIRIRFDAGINRKMEITWGARRFKIAQPPINPDEANRVLDILAVEEL